MRPSRLLFLLLLPLLAAAAEEYGRNGLPPPPDGQNILLPHKKNYLLFYTYDFTDHEDTARKEEAKFQLSIKIPFRYELLDFYLGYTQKAFWQIYDKDNTRPFREIDHNPELFAVFAPPENGFLGLKKFQGGYEHDSNGEPIETSLAWNRLYLQGFWEEGSLKADLKVWYWLKKPPKKDPLDPEGDETPGIENYFGHGELHGSYRYRTYTLEATLRNNLNPERNLGAVQLDLIGPLTNVSWYIQYWRGYGESLMDYKTDISKLGAGVLFTY